MRPTRQQIEIAAYHRWERRGAPHGDDRGDWVAAEKDLTFGLNYRYLARHRLDGPAVLLGKDAGRRRRCRFCEQSAPSATFAEPPALLSHVPGNAALHAWDECDECRSGFDDALAGASAWLSRPDTDTGEVPVGALKALVRLGLAVLPADELHHVGDTIEWVNNPDHDLDAGILDDLGCHVYRPFAPVLAPFVALARRADDEAPWPYLLVFLATSRVVFQAHLPLCNRDEDLEGEDFRGPELSMSLGLGEGHRASPCVFLPAAAPGLPSPSGRRKREAVGT